jgi:Rieske Fe-S protein
VNPDERETDMADHTSCRWLIIATFGIVSALAQAASGFNITQSDESKVAIGMDATEVQRSLGPPARIVRYPRQPGPTWTYNVIGAPFGITKFDIEFGADGKVVSASERIIGNPY